MLGRAPGRGSGATRFKGRGRIMKRRGESYHEDYAGGAVARCVVPGCDASVVAEVDDDCYSDALESFRGVYRAKLRCRRAGDPRLFCCDEHLRNDPRASRLQWQMLIAFSEEGSRD
jgi:hypothetical protein